MKFINVDAYIKKTLCIIYKLFAILKMINKNNLAKTLYNLYFI